MKKLLASVLCLLIGVLPVLAQNPVTTTYLNAQKQASPPANPPAGYNRIWVGTDNFVKVKQPDGTTQFMPYYLSSLDGIILATDGVLSQFAPAPGGGDAAKFLRGDGTWADAGAAGFALQTQTSFTNNSTPAIYLKAPGPNTTPFLEFLDSSDVSKLKVYYNGGVESAGEFYSGTGIYATTGTSISLRTAGNIDVGVFREYGSLSFEGAQPSTSGVPKAWLDFTGTQNNTGITASTEYNAFWYNPPRTYTWSTGTITNQRFFYLRAPTLAFGGASTVTNASTFTISGAPIAGTNATIANPYALWVASGLSQFDGRINAVNSDGSNPLIQGQNDTGTALRGISLSGYGAYLTSRSSIGANIAQTGTLPGNTTAATALIKREHVLSGFTSTGPVLQVEQATGTGNLLSLVNSGGTAAAFDQNGVLLIGGAASPGTNTKLQLGTPTTTNNSVNIYLEPTGTTITPLAIQGNSSQTADLFQTFNSSGTKLFFVNAKGVAGGGPTTSITVNAFGYEALNGLSSGGADITAVGYRAGYSLAGSGNYNTLIGASAGTTLTTGNYNVAIGSSALLGDQELSSSVIIGHNTMTQGTGTYTGTGPVLVVGRDAGSDLTTQNNIAVFGSSTSPLNDWYFGESYKTTSPSDITFQPSVGSGADKAGADFFIRGGAGTGNGEPGTIVFQTTTIGSSGSTLQTNSTVATIDYGGLLLNAGRLRVPQIKGISSAPSISAGAGAGTGASVSLAANSNDISGEFTVTTGTTPTADGTVLTITFSAAAFNAPFPSVAPTNDNAASLFSGQEDLSPNFYYETTTTTLVVKVNGTLPEATTYKVAYHLFQ